MMRKLILIVVLGLSTETMVGQQVLNTVANGLWWNPITWSGTLVTPNATLGGRVLSGFSVTVPSGNYTGRSVKVEGTLNITNGGELNVLDTLYIAEDGSLNITDGRILCAGIVYFDDSISITPGNTNYLEVSDDIYFDGNQRIEVIDGSLRVYSSLKFEDPIIVNPE